MGWKDNLQKASYRGVPFFVEGAGKSTGRRTAVHEFIARDKPYAEDMGAKTKTFSVSAYLLGDDYITQRDALEAALEKGGPGTLVHPTRGTLEVSVTDVDVDERLSEEAGIARLTISFVESGRLEFPTSAVDKLYAVDKSALGVASAATQDFIAKFKAASMPEFVQAFAAADIGSLSDTLLGFDFPGASTDAVSSFIKQANNLKVNAVRLMAEPASLANQITGLIQQVRSIAGLSSGAAATPFKPLVAFKSVAPATTATPSQAQALANGNAITALIRDTAVGEQASAAMRDDYDSYDKAVDTRDTILATIDAQGDTASDEVYVSLQTLRAQVVESLPAPEEDLPRLSSVYLPVSFPAIVLAYSLYDDATRDGEIVRRNSIRHPGFLPANRKLQVLSDG